MSKYGRRVPRVCAFCQQPFMARPEKIKAGHGRFCRKGCSVASRAWLLNYPDAVDLIALMFPVMSTRALARFVGITYTCISSHARRHGLVKDPDWLRENGHDQQWPKDPALREVYALSLQLKTTINRRSKELE